MPNVELLPPHTLSTFRRLALGIWKNPYDPTVYGALVLPADAALDYVAAYREATGKKVTLTHFAGKAVAFALRRVPAANALLQRGRPRVRRAVDVCFQVLLDGEAGADLTVMTVRNVDQLDLGALADAFNAKVERTRKGQDLELEHTRHALSSLPGWLLRYSLRFTSFMVYTLNLDLHALGVPKDAFGSVLLSNVGTLGLDDAYVPLMAYTRVPLQLALGAVHWEPVVEDGKVVPRRRVKLNATFDHRLMDGYHAKLLAEALRECFERPEEAFGPIARR